jgi:hypothetical protein
VKEALKEALANTDGPVVVDVVVNPYALSLPAHDAFVPHGKESPAEPGQAGAGRPDRRRNQDDGARRPSRLGSDPCGGSHSADEISASGCYCAYQLTVNTTIWTD